MENAIILYHDVQKISASLYQKSDEIRREAALNVCCGESDGNGGTCSACGLRLPLTSAIEQRADTLESVAIWLVYFGL